MKARTAACLITCVLAWCSHDAHAALPYARNHAHAPGLTVAEAQAMVQDRAGFIWIASIAGVVRFDGRAGRGFAPDDRPCFSRSLARYGNGIIVTDRCGRLFSVDASGRLRVWSTPGTPLAVATDSRDRVHAIIGNRLWRWQQGAWKVLDQPQRVHEVQGFRPRLHSLREGVLLAMGDDSWWLQGAAATRIGVGGVVAVAEDGTHPLALLTEFPGEVWRAAPVGRRFERVYTQRDRGIGLVYRRDTLWAAYDVGLVALGESDQRRYPQNAELPSGGPLLVDHEGSLWIASLSRLLQLPEPDAQRLDVSDGLVSSHAYGLAAHGVDTLALTWQGAHALTPSFTVAAGAPLDANGRACALPGGGLLVPGEDRWQRFRGGVATPLEFTVTDDDAILDCAIARDQLLVATGTGVFTVTGERVRRVLRGLPQPDGLQGQGVSALAVQGDTLWLARGARICAVTDNALAAPDAKDCFECAGVQQITALVDAGHRSMLAIATPLGLVELRGRTCRALPVNEALRTRWLHGLRSARDGGFWAFGPNDVVRVARARPQAEYVVVERIGSAQGLGSVAAFDVLDRRDALMVANFEGVTHIPRSARLRANALPAPRVAIVRKLADGAPLENGAYLDASTRSIDLELAALSYRAPERLRFRAALDGDARGIVSVSPHITLTGLGAGKHALALQASVDGLRWGPAAHLAFAIAPRWYRTWWALALAVALVACSFWFWGQLRAQRRAALRAQREAIAADLHDELGSELAGIGLVSALLEQDGLTAAERSGLLRELRAGTTELGYNLRDLVRAMKAGPVEPAQLSAELARVARRIVPGPRPRLQCDANAAALSTTLTPFASRQLLLIASEALSNAARHSNASLITVALRPGDQCLQLRIVDDGCGFDVQHAATGMGLTSLRERAARLKAVLTVESSPGHGCAVTLDLPLRA